MHACHYSNQLRYIQIVVDPGNGFRLDQLSIGVRIDRRAEIPPRNNLVYYTISILNSNPKRTISFPSLNSVDWKICSQAAVFCAQVGQEERDTMPTRSQLTRWPPVHTASKFTKHFLHTDSLLPAFLQQAFPAHQAFALRP
jgi:hypothetical protein